MSRRGVAACAVLVVSLFAHAPAQPSRAQVPSRAPTDLRAPRETGLDALVKNFEFSELASAVAAMPASDERDYFAGILANRQGRVAESARLLERALAAPWSAQAPAERAAVALRTLADDYVKLYRYRDAAQKLALLLRSFSSTLDKAELDSTQDDYNTFRLLEQAPPQTVSFNGPINLATHRNATLNTIDAKLTVNGVAESWILDTGANTTAVSAGFARRLGVPVSTEKAQTKGITGAENDLRAAILPELTLGGATVRNVVLIVLDDESFNVPVGRGHYQINAVLGYPVLQALQRVTFTDDGRMLAGPESPGAKAGATLYMKELMPLVECAVAGRPVLFSFDTGADRSLFSARYYKEFPGQFKGMSPRPYAFGGAGGVKRVAAHYLPQVQLGVGATTVTLHDVPVVPPLGTDTDKVFGNLGRDVTDPYRSFTIDFEHMRLRLGDKR
ncbi:MAG: retropepsin-like aspartic protease [Bacteroidales bacterium]